MVVAQVEVVEHALPGSTHTDLLTSDIKWMGRFEGRCLLGGRYICDCVNKTHFIYISNYNTSK